MTGYSAASSFWPVDPVADGKRFLEEMVVRVELERGRDTRSEAMSCSRAVNYAGYHWSCWGRAGVVR
jgi:hypothetical protein